MYFFSKKALLLLLLLIVSSTSLFAQNCGNVPPADNTVYPWCFRFNEGTTWDTRPYKPYIINGMPFRLLFPKGFDSTSTVNKKYPLVVLLHGIGENGTDNNLQLKYGGREHLAALNNGSYDGFVMVPQARQDLWNSAERATILTFVQKAIQDLQVDPFRVQLEGYSGGGTAAWKLAYENPKVFAAAIIMSSADGSTAESYAQALKYTAIWHAQGGRDTRPSPITGNRVAEVFTSAGANYRYQYYHELGHGTWGAMYREPDFFPFLMRNSMLRIHAKFFKYNFCEGEPISGVLGVKEGFEGYEWRKDGSPVGTNSNELQFSGLGAYTVRIKHNGAWSVWSDPLQVRRLAPTATPVVTAEGPTALPALDGRTTVTLHAPKGYQAYRWSDGSTLDSLVVSTPGTYSVSVTEPYGCPSAFSSPVQVTVGASGVLPAPADFSVGAVSESVLRLRWTDNSTNETGVEVYRSSSPEGPWSLVAQLPANTTSYRDEGLNSYTRYFYSLRAVNTAGGSAYTSGSGKTYADAVPPGIPANLIAGKTSRTSVALSWTPAADATASSSPLAYEIYQNDTLAGTTTRTAFTVNDLEGEQFYTFTVRAVDEAGNKSAFSNQVTAGTFINGLYYSYYEGSLTTVHDISLLQELASGRTPVFDITKDRQVNDNFAYTFEGFINVPATGTYTFYTTSDDGSTLSINGVEVVNNDGRHTSEERAGTIELTEGVHAINVLYFEAQGRDQMLEVRWEGPGITKEIIPESAFTETYTPPTPPAAPSAITATAVNDHSIALTWTDNNTTPARFEIYRSTSNTGTFGLVKTIAAPATTFTDQPLQPATTYYYKLRAVGPTGESEFSGESAGQWVHATTPAGTLQTPTALVALRNGSEAVTLTWTDNASTESGYEIWRKAEGEEYQQLITIAANLTTYSDAGIAAGIPYQYRVRAVGASGQSEWSNEATLSNENAPPVLAGFPEVVRVPEGTTTEIIFDAYDPEGDSLHLISRYLPDFAKVEVAPDGKGRIVLRPAVKDMGYYNGIQLTATDGVLETDITYTIHVRDSEKSATYINIGNSSVAPAPWNNTNTYAGQGNQVVLQNLLNEFGEETGYSLTLIDPWSANKPYGETSGNDSGIYPDVVTNSAYIINPGETAAMKVSGLNPDTRYNFVFYGSSVYKSHNGSTNYTIGDETVTLAVQSNRDKTVQINGVLPDGNGEVVLTVAGAGDATKGGFLNALVIEEYPDNGQLLRPSRFQVHPLSRTAAALSWVDNSYQEGGFEIWRRKLPADSFQLVTTTAANITSYVDEGLQANTGYEYKVRAAANGGFSNYSQAKQVATLLYKVFINTNFTRNAGDPWNNLDRRPTTGFTWHNFANDDMQHTGINLRLDESFDGNNVYGPDANGQGLYPDNVIASYYYNEIGTTAKMRFYGLDDELTYNFRFFAASAFDGGENGVTEYRIGTKKVTLDVDNNLSNTAVIRNVQPVNGSIVVEVEAGAFARYGYLNAIELEVRNAYKEQRGATPDAVVVTGVDNPQEQEAVRQLVVYPNPARDKINIQFAAKAAGTYEVQVYSATGSLLQAQRIVAVPGSNTLTLTFPAAGMSKGIYLLRISGNGVTSKGVRFVKQ